MRRKHQRQGLEESAVGDEAGKAREAGDTHAPPEEPGGETRPSPPLWLVLFTVGLFLASRIAFLPSGPSCYLPPSGQPLVQGLPAAGDRSAWALGSWTPHSTWGDSR